MKRGVGVVVLLGAVLPLAFAEPVHKALRWTSVCLFSQSLPRGNESSFDWDFSGDTEGTATLTCCHYAQDDPLSRLRSEVPVKTHTMETKWADAEALWNQAKDASLEICGEFSEAASQSARLYKSQQEESDRKSRMEPAARWLAKYVRTDYINMRAHMKAKIMRAYRLSDEEADTLLDRYGYR